MSSNNRAGIGLAGLISGCLSGVTNPWSISDHLPFSISLGACEPTWFWCLSPFNGHTATANQDYILQSTVISIKEKREREVGERETEGKKNNKNYHKYRKLELDWRPGCCRDSRRWLKSHSTGIRLRHAGQIVEEHAHMLTYTRAQTHTPSKVKMMELAPESHLIAHAHTNWHKVDSWTTNHCRRSLTSSKWAFVTIISVSAAATRCLILICCLCERNCAAPQQVNTLKC